ncbi:MAG TPA: hypothetical protein VGH98_16740 [Gemmatimonadaceae bacterium]
MQDMPHLIHRMAARDELRFELVEQLARCGVGRCVAIGEELVLRPLSPESDERFRPPVCGVRILVLFANLAIR